MEQKSTDPSAALPTRALQEHLDAYLELDRRLDAQGFSVGLPQITGVARLVADPTPGPVPGAVLAAAVRAEHGLGTGPVQDLFQLAHAAVGLDVFSVDISGVVRGDVEQALSATSPATGRTAVAVTTSRRPMLQRLAVALEFGRRLVAAVDGLVDGGVGGSGPGAPERAEAFARHLLLPAEEVIARYGGLEVVDLRQLSDLVQAFQVPPGVAAVQLREAGLVDPGTCAAWTELLAARLATRFGWRSQFGLLSAAASTPRAPQALVARAVEAHLAGALDLEELARWSGQHPADLERELDAAPGRSAAGASPATEHPGPVPASPRHDPDLGSYVPTPATTALAAHLRAGDPAAAAAVLDEHWMEVWYAVDPTDLRTLLERLPAELLDGLANAYYLRRITGAATGPRPSQTGRRGGVAGVEEVAQVIADLRMSGRPAAAMTHVDSLAEEVRVLRGQIVGSSGGRVELWLVQGAITALLAGDLATARSTLLEAVRVRRPDRFPFVRREAAAKLALVVALLSGSTEAAEWIAQARRMPVSGSWVEDLVDDTLWLAEYLCAIDALDLDRAEELRLARPSPLDHLEFWGVALQAHVRHLVLTGRHQQAQALCDSVQGMGLPLPGSDGWLATMLDDAHLMALGPGRLPVPRDEQAQSPVAVLGHRVALLSAGQYEAGTARHPYEADDAHDPRVRLALRLLRAQSLVAVGRQLEGRALLDATLADVEASGLRSVLGHLTPETLAALAATPTGAAVADLVRSLDLPLVRVEPLLTAPLTASETRVLELLAVGFSRQQIADTLVVSLSTVKSQLRTAYQKLGASDRDEAVAKLERLGIVG